MSQLLFTDDEKTNEEIADILSKFMLAQHKIAEINKSMVNAKDIEDLIKLYSDMSTTCKETCTHIDSLVNILSTGIENGTI